MDFLVEYSKTIYFHRALSLWLKDTEILPKQKGVLPFSKSCNFYTENTGVFKKTQYSTSVQN